MNEQNYTSLELSKRLAENGCKLESDFVWADEYDSYYIIVPRKSKIAKLGIPIYPAYDILNDICVKYAKEFFGEKPIYVGKFGQEDNFTPAYKFYSKQILHLLQQNEKEEAEKYIWENTIFNKNKNI